jgi:hypothetical protein
LIRKISALEERIDMSYTELFGLTKNTTSFIGETNNSWRGAMAIWKIFEKRYLPKYVPDWAIAIGEPDKDYTRCSSCFSKDMQIIKNIDKVLAAFREFDGETSLKEQADVIEQAIKENPEIIAIGWNQTSVNGDTWETENYSEKADECAGYNLETGTRHWFLVEELEKENGESK